ncbi:MAG: hypothetical protein LBV19_01555 [Streptococcaceae bacterium]|jgi:hypothetical protein|nr:hypothetical protein [Streptococcaceae bacterium]
MIQDISALIGAVTGIISLIWTVFQQKTISKIKTQLNLNNSGLIGKGSKAGGDIAGRDIKK